MYVCRMIVKEHDRECVVTCAREGGCRGSGEGLVNGAANGAGGTRDADVGTWNEGNWNN